MASGWFELTAWVASPGLRLSAGHRRRHVVLGNWQHMAIMDPAFRLPRLHGTDRSLGIFRARTADVPQADAHAHGRDGGCPRDSLGQVSVSDSHCGAGCVLGDIVGERIVWATAWTIGSTAALGPDTSSTYRSPGSSESSFIILRSRRCEAKWSVGATEGPDQWTRFRYSASRPVSSADGSVEYLIWNAPIDSSSHWFLMQIGMMLGFVTSWPVNRWLLRHGIKEPMPTA